MPRFDFEAMDATGLEVRDTIDAPNEVEAQTTIRQMGYFVTKICEKGSRRDVDPCARHQRRRLINLKFASLTPAIYAVVGFVVGTIFGLLIRGVFQ